MEGNDSGLRLVAGFGIKGVETWSFAAGKLVNLKDVTRKISLAGGV